MTYNRYSVLSRPLQASIISTIIVLPRSVSERGAKDLREGGRRGQDLLHLRQGGAADKAAG